MPAAWDINIADNGLDGREGIRININPEFVSDITGRTEPYKHMPRTLKPVLEKVADYVMITMIPRTFQQEGPGWRPLARRTRAERAAQGYGAEHPILIRTRDLFNELTKRSHPKHVEIIKTGKNSRIIIGGSSEKFVRNQAGNFEFHIPSRPMIPGTGGLKLPDRDRREISRILDVGIRQRLRSQRK